VEERIRGDVKSIEIDQLPRRQRDLGDIAGNWADDPAFEAALADQDTTLQIGDGAESDSAAGKAGS